MDFRSPVSEPSVPPLSVTEGAEVVQVTAMTAGSDCSAEAAVLHPPQDHLLMDVPASSAAALAQAEVQTTLPAIDTVSFWAEWNAHKEKLQCTVDEYIVKQEQLVKGLMLQDMSTIFRGEKKASLNRVPSCSSSQLTGLSPSWDFGVGAGSPQISDLGSSNTQASNFKSGSLFMRLSRSGGSAGRGLSALGSIDILGEDSEPSTALSSPRPLRSVVRERFINTYDSSKRRDLQATHVDKLAATVSSRFKGSAADVPPLAVMVISWWHSLKEPNHTSRLAKVVLHRYFDLVIVLVILCNAICTAWQANREMESLGSGYGPATPLDLVFVIIYTLELVLKLMVHRMYFFCNSDMFGNVTFARSLRLFKMGKILRIFRAMRLMKELRVMLASIVGSCSSLFWSFVMIGMINYIFALFFMQQMTVELSANQLDPPDSVEWESQRFFFRSVERTCLTLMEATMGGLDWDVVFKLIEPLGLVYVLAFIFYIAFFNFAVLNILTGIFVENAMKLCKPDFLEAFAMQRDQRQREEKELHRIVTAMDLDDDGRIIKDDFVAMASFPEVTRCFAAVGIDVCDPVASFKMVASPEGHEVFSVDDFVDRMKKMKLNMHSGIDLHGLQSQAYELKDSLEQIRCSQQEEYHKELGNLRAQFVASSVALASTQPLSAGRFPPEGRELGDEVALPKVYDEGRGPPRGLGMGSVSL
mmetsp:Transcript_127902/g.409725  ORF Transcript_127902/g.409725 Transcript_127902/m.409725 type:complete len:699 (-) Transcript_127902:95-2191(-)